jgi:hypothetical protein
MYSKFGLIIGKTWNPLQFGLEDPPFQVGNSRADMESFPVLIVSEPGGFQHPSLNVSQEVS